MPAAKLDNEIYTLPLGELYIDKFQEFSNDNVIDLDSLNSLELKERYEIKKRFFDYVCNYLAMFKDDEDKEFGPQLHALCQRMWRTDSLAEYLAEERKYEGAIKALDNLIRDMLSVSNKMFKGRNR